MEGYGMERDRGQGPWLIIVVLVLVILAGGFVALRFVAPGLIPGWGEKKAGPGTGPETGAKELYPMKPFIVNLADPSGRRYLKLTLSFELGHAELKKELDVQVIQIQDAVLTVLRAQTYEGISTVEGEMKLKTELLARVNTLLKSGKVSNVYFSEFVVQ
jgi:flagellar FliL protein